MIQKELQDVIDDIDLVHIASTVHVWDIRTQRAICLWENKKYWKWLKFIVRSNLPLVRSGVRSLNLLFVCTAQLFSIKFRTWFNFNFVVISFCWLAISTHTQQLRYIYDNTDHKYLWWTRKYCVWHPDLNYAYSLVHLRIMR